jgi:DNA-binding NarL/FixJ family response regulator
LSRRILLADDHPLFREALTVAVSRAAPDFDVEGVESLAEAQASLRAEPDVALVLLDLRLTDAQGFQGLLALRAEFSHAPIVVVSASEDAATISNAIAYGAVGFIPKSAGLATLGDALRAILEGDVWTPPGKALPPPEPGAIQLASLTTAQMRVLAELRRGRSNKQIAHDLGVTEATVKAHITQIMRKLNVVNRTQILILVQAILGAPEDPT